MKKDRIFLIIILVMAMASVSCTSLAGLIKNQDPAAKQLLGKWQVIEMDGTPVNTNFSKSAGFIFKPRGEIIVTYDNQPGSRFEYKLGKKDELNSIKIYSEEINETIYGIYKFEQDKAGADYMILKTRNKHDGIYPDNFYPEDGYTLEKFKKIE